MATIYTVNKNRFEIKALEALNKKPVYILQNETGQDWVVSQSRVNHNRAYPSSLLSMYFYSTPERASEHAALLNKRLASIDMPEFL